MIFSRLSPTQQAQAELTFRDSHFGADPSAYEYEITGGRVTGRVPLAKGGRSSSRPRKVAVTMMTIEIEPTAAQVNARQQAVKSLGRMLVEQMMEARHV